jgi:hypothetical protein
MTTNIQNSPKPTKTKHKDCNKPCCSSKTPNKKDELDNYTESVEREAETKFSITHEKHLLKRKRTDFLKDKNTGKKLKTKKEIQTNKNTRHTYCGCSAQKDFVSIETNIQTNYKNQKEVNNFITGTALCKEIWRCPTCSMKLLKGRASEILQLTQAHQNKGYKLGFVTLTVQHSKDDTLKQTLDKLLNNYRKFQSHKHFRTLKNTYLIGQVKSLEITITKQNGWHPHLHILYFYKTTQTDGIEDIQNKIITDWANYTDGSPKAQNQQVVYTDKHITDYITKWDAIQELTNDFKKTSKGIKPFQLLTILTKKQHYFKSLTFKKSIDFTTSLWLEYVETTKGKRRITTSRKLNELYKIEEKTDEQILAQNPDGEKIISFSQDTWKTIYKHNLQPHLLYICDINPNLKTQQKEILKYLLEFDDFYLDKREWDILKLTNEPIIRKKSEKEAILDLTNFSYN